MIYQLQLRGLSFLDLAHEAGVGSSAISNVFSHPNIHLETFVAQKVGLTVCQLFPERFDAGGNRIVRTREQSRNRPRRHRERSKAKAG